MNTLHFLGDFLVPIFLAIYKNQLGIIEDKLETICDHLWTMRLVILGGENGREMTLLFFMIRGITNEYFENRRNETEDKEVLGHIKKIMKIYICKSIEGIKNSKYICKYFNKNNRDIQEIQTLLIESLKEEIGKMYKSFHDFSIQEETFIREISEVVNI